VRVLIVDESAPVRARLRERFADGGVEVLEVENLAGAALIDLASVDAVLFDVHGRGGGVAGVETLRARLPAALIVVLTNEASEHHRRECTRSGADHFFDKSREFESAVEVALARLGASTS
jgi:DNA-binding NarL/FixJ family response regulator